MTGAVKVGHSGAAYTLRAWSVVAADRAGRVICAVVPRKETPRRPYPPPMSTARPMGETSSPVSWENLGCALGSGRTDGVANECHPISSGSVPALLMESHPSQCPFLEIMITIYITINHCQPWPPMKTYELGLQIEGTVDKLSWSENCLTKVDQNKSHFSSKIQPIVCNTTVLEILLIVCFLKNSK